MSHSTARRAYVHTVNEPAAVCSCCAAAAASYHTVVKEKERCSDCFLFFCPSKVRHINIPNICNLPSPESCWQLATFFNSHPCSIFYIHRLQTGIPGASDNHHSKLSFTYFFYKHYLINVIWMKQALSLCSLRMLTSVSTHSHCALIISIIQYASDFKHHLTWRRAEFTVFDRPQEEICCPDSVWDFK